LNNTEKSLVGLVVYYRKHVWDIVSLGTLRVTVWREYSHTSLRYRQDRMIYYSLHIKVQIGKFMSVKIIDKGNEFKGYKEIAWIWIKWDS